MLQRRDYPPLVLEGGIALKPADRCHAHLRDQVRVFAEGLFDPPPARVSRHVDHGRERLVRSAQPRLLGGHCIKRFHQRRIKARRQTDGLRKTGRADPGVAVQAFFVKHNRDPQPRVFQEEPLDGVGQLRHFTRVLAFACIAWSAYLAQPMTFFKMGFGFSRVKIPVGIQEGLRLFLPDAHHLSGFLLERHSYQEVLDALAGG